MDNWTTFPDLFEQLSTDQQPQPYPFGYLSPSEFHSDNEPASHDFLSAQQATSLLEPLHILSMSQEPVLHVPQDTLTASVEDPGTTATAMSPPPKRRKKKAPTLRDKDWEPYKDRILELRDTQELSLQEIKETIEKEYGFTAEYGSSRC